MSKQEKTLPVWRTESDLMDRLRKAQNYDTSRDIMTFAGFMNSRQELEAYVVQNGG